MTRVIDWYFDFISPYAYLVSRRLQELPDDVELRFKPVLFAGLLGHYGQLGPAEIPEKRRHTAMLTMWRARMLGVPFVGPPRHPFNPLPVLRLAIALGATRAVVDAIFTHIWAEGRDGQSPESLAQLSAALGGVDLAELTGRPDVKATLRANTDEAIARGVFGVPSFVVEDRVFWGEDMVAPMLAWLQDPSALESAALEAALATSPAAERSRPISPSETAPNWSIHHVNLPATDVRASAAFYRDILGLEETAWTFPPAEQVGHISADPARLTLFPAATAAQGRNAGLHLIAPEPAFARKNDLDHNPSIGGHVAIQVPDLDAVRGRLEAAGVPYSYAPTFAIPGMRHIYVYDPAMNLLEINAMDPPASAEPAP